MAYLVGSIIKDGGRTGSYYRNALTCFATMPKSQHGYWGLALYILASDTAGDMTIAKWTCMVQRGGHLSQIACSFFDVPEYYSDQDMLTIWGTWDTDALE